MTVCSSCGVWTALEAHDLCARCDEGALGETWFCGNCALEWPEAFCSACGLRLVETLSEPGPRPSEPARLGSLSACAEDAA